jgi:hypothetical protein
MKKIDELSREELSSIIYHYLPTTRTFDHPVLCASCGDGSAQCHFDYTDEYNPKMIHDATDVEVLFYVCDRCEENE